METLAILEALIKWEDKLIGIPIHIITDHKALEFFNTQSRLSRRQYQWTEYLSRFNFDITYIKGEYNKVADCLSQYFESDLPTENQDPHEYVTADKKMDSTGEDLPKDRFIELKDRVIEIRAMHEQTLRRSSRLQEK